VKDKKWPFRMDIMCGDRLQSNEFVVFFDTNEKMQRWTQALAYILGRVEAKELISKPVIFSNPSESLVLYSSQSLYL